MHASRVRSPWRAAQVSWVIGPSPHCSTRLRATMHGPGPHPTPPMARPRWHARAVLFILIGAVLWAIFAWGVAPAILRAGYEGTSIGPVNALFEFRHEHPFEHYRAKFSHLAAVALACWVALGALTLGFDSRAFATRFVPPATPGTIGMIRCLVCLLGIYYVTYWDDLPALANLPPEMRKPMGSLEFFYRIPVFAAMVGSETALRGFRAILVALFVFGAVGFQTRVVLPIASVLFLAFGGLVRSYQWYYHNGLIPWYILTALCFMPAGDGFSFDRLIRIRRGQPVPPRDAPTMRYGWARYVVWMCVALPYVEAGASKLRNTGLDWWHAANMRQMLSADSLKPNTERENLTLKLNTAPDWIFAGLGLAGVGGELLMGLVLFSATARWVMPAMMFTMHLGIRLLQGILFLDLMVLEAVFYDWRRARLWIARKLGRRRAASDSAGGTAPREEWRGEDPAAYGAPVPRWGVLRPAGIALLTVVLAAAWYERLEWFPLTGMQMYSQPRSAHAKQYIDHLKIYATDEAGNTWPADIKRMSGVARYWRVLDDGLSPTRNARRPNSS